ncbi:MAG: winged helix-turn-helix domain-containing protein [Acetatifactor sp.]
MNSNPKGKILIYGGKNSAGVSENLCSGCGYEVIRIGRKNALREMMEWEETKLLLFDFQGAEAGEASMLSLLTELRGYSRKPILALVDKKKEMLRILALNAGADDVLDQREDSPMEFMARIQSKIRSYRRLTEHEERSSFLRMKDLELDDGAKLVLVKGNRVDLTPTEYKILRLLMEQPGRVLSNKQIYESIWKMEPIGADNTIAVHIRHIREKIEDNPQSPHYLQVVWGQGYKVG